ncbi:MAG: PAS domain S-box protein [Anaerolineales bacterium]|nr:PAS domain S-box protein [Anaerolineales bacterium]
MTPPDGPADKPQNGLLRVLILEDSHSDTLLLLREIRRSGYEVAYRQVQTAAALQTALDADTWDVILSDYSMPGFDAHEALHIVRQQRQMDIPFIIISGTIGEDIAVTAMRAGANDFFPKGKLMRLVPAIERELGDAEERRKRRMAERRLRHSQEEILATINLLEKTFASLSEAVFVIDPLDRRIRLCNAAVYPMLGHKREALIGQTTEMIHVDASAFQRFGDLCDSALQRENVFHVEYQLRHQSGRILQTEHTVTRLDAGQGALSGFVSVVRDITARKESEAQLRYYNARLLEQAQRHAQELEQRVQERTAELQHQKERIETILRNSSDAILLLTQDGRILQANRAFCVLFGCAETAVVGLSFPELADIQQITPLQQALQRVAGEKAFQQIELTAQKADGEAIEVDAVLTHVENSDGSHAEIVCSLRDITLKKQVETELRNALQKEKELNDLKTGFISMVSHEFRTPLTVIQISTDILQALLDGPGDVRQQKRFAIINQQVRYLSQLMTEVLFLSRADQAGLAFHPEAVDLVALSQMIIDDLKTAYAADRRILFEYDAGCRQRLADPNLYQHVLQNLLSNALKYSPDTSSVHVALRCTAAQTTLRVQDQGIGMPAAFQQNLFKSFHRADNVGNVSGTGLGLAIVKRAVDAHGGHIDVDSTEGVGTSFVVWLPNEA